MLKRLLITLVLFVPINATAVYFPGGIDWTHPSQDRFVQSLFLNMLGRAPSAQETQERVANLRRNDNRTARLRMFESLLTTSEYQQNFERRGNWGVYRAPDYNYNNGNGYWRYQAGLSAPEGFSELPGSNRVFPEGVARSVAHYYEDFCYRGETCIDNPELARERSDNPLASTAVVHACADPAIQTTQYKWVALNGTTYPFGVGEDLICMQDHYYQINQLALQRYECDSGYVNCERNSRQDLSATRSGTDNSGNTSLFFRDGSRLTLLSTDAVATTSPTPRPTGPQHECADSGKTSSRFLWQSPGQTAESTGIGSNTICMDNYYYLIKGLTLIRYQCQQGFTNCQEDPQNNLSAAKRARVNGNPGLEFDNGTTVSLTERGSSAIRSSTATRDTTTNNSSVARSQPRSTNGQVARDPVARTNTSNTTTRSTVTSGTGTDCANPRARLSQFRWKSDGLSSWPDGIDGRIICLQNNYYEITANALRHYTCQDNFSNCRSNPSEDLSISQISSDGTVRNLSNGDEVTVVTQ